MTKSIIAGVFLALVMSSCGGGEVKNETEMSQEKQTVQPIHSFAKPDVSVVKHLFLDVSVSFEKNEVSGWVHYDLESAVGAERVILDVKNLEILQVMIDSAETKNWWLGEEKPFMGQALEIEMTDQTKTVSVKYSSVNSDAIFWLKNGDKPPFMFTQSQAILARTWLPCQDSPGIRYTYNARVKVDQGLMALMSATNPIALDSTGLYEFEMKQPIPSYLMALAVGDVRYQKLGANTGVYALPEVIESAAYEFEDMQKMLESAEKLYGKYAWEVYDALVLPASFPFGGMENPRLTFATPTILAGDKSLTALVAHELAHSWSGNLVTNATWNDFWLNEGFTVYFERRIMEDVYGKDYADMLSILGRQDLAHTLEEMADQPDDTRLKLTLDNRDPDDGMTDIAYEKGFFFLRTLEKEVGREKLDAFLNQHFSENAFKTITTEIFLTNLKNQLLEGDQSRYEALRIDEWVYQPGLPSNCFEVKSVLFEQVMAQVDSFNNGVEVSKIDTAGWTTHQWLYFLRNMPERVAFDRLYELDKAYAFTKTGNSEIAAEWFVVAIENGYGNADAALKDFLLKVGRRKFLIPLYSALIKADENDPTKNRALEIYNEAKSNYHSVSTNTLDAMLKL
jgi:leukotriene-A4 hydrolase